MRITGPYQYLDPMVQRSMSANLLSAGQELLTFFYFKEASHTQKFISCEQHDGVVSIVLGCNITGYGYDFQLGLNISHEVYGREKPLHQRRFVTHSTHTFPDKYNLRLFHCYYFPPNKNSEFTPFCIQNIVLVKQE